MSQFGMAEYALASPSFTSFLNKLNRENEVGGPTCTSDLIFNVFTGSEAAIVQKDALTCMEFRFMKTSYQINYSTISLSYFILSFCHSVHH